MNFIVETKNEYTIQLVNILSPLIYEGFDSIYSETKKIIKRGEENKMLKTFQQFIKKIPLWNNNLINIETRRIVSQSRCEWLHDLLKAVIKANIILLSNSNPSANGSYIVNSDYLDIPLEQFVHKCYIECARQIYTCPYLFFHNVKPIDRKRNQRECLTIINSSIKEAIRKMLPVQHILKLYLGNDLKTDNNEIDMPISLNESENLKNLVSKDLKDFINPEVVQNFKSENDIIKEDSSSSPLNSQINKGDETANLLDEIKKKYNEGFLLEKLTQKSNNESKIEKNSYIKDTSESENIINSINKVSIDSINKTNISDNELRRSGLDYDDSISKDRVKSINTSESKNTIKTFTNIEDDVIDTNKSEFYKAAHDSEYEGVFSNINDKYKDNIDSEKREKKKRKDEYFSKYNNI